jgi:hypothetical protein
MCACANQHLQADVWLGQHESTTSRPAG